MWNIFTLVKSFAIFWQLFISTWICQFLYIYLDISSNGINFSMSTIVLTVSSFEYWMQMLREQGLGEKAIISSYTVTKGESWALLRKSAVESTALAQPFCVNQTVGDLPWHFHFMSEYSKLDRVKTIATRGNINAIWWNIKINLQKLVDIIGYELPTNLQNFMQKDLSEVKNIPKSFRGATFFWNTL